MNKSKKKSKGLLPICVAVVMAAVLIGWMIFVSQNRTADGKDISDASSFKTVYGKLYYPEKWAEQIRVDITEDDFSSTVSFIACLENSEENPLFDVLFNQEKGAYLGDIAVDKGKSVSVSIVSYELRRDVGWSEANIDTYQTMQDDVNYLIERLPLTRNEAQENHENLSEETVPENTEEVEDIVIETPYGQLYYPGRWASQLRVKQAENQVDFYAVVEGLSEIHLFDICFGVAEEEALGYIENYGERCYIAIRFYDIPEDSSWEDDQVEALWAIQEDVNYLTEKMNLVYLGQYYAAENAEDAEIRMLTIETPYCKLQYPTKWEAYLETVVSKYGEYTVSFRAALPEKESVALFDIIFGGSGDELLGTLVTSDGITVPVSLKMYNFDFTDSWTMEDQDIVYEMAESVNELLTYLPLAEG